MDIKASAKGVRMSPRKVGVVAALVRNRTVAEAVTILEHTPRRSSEPVRKIIESARANATNNHSLVEDTLIIKSISVTPGPRMKRFRPAAHGRALPFEKKSSHIYIELTGQKKEPKKPAAKKPVETKEPK